MSSNSKKSEQFMPCTTRIDKRQYLALMQLQYDLGLPYIQDVVRLLISKGLSVEGYPKENHKIKSLK